MSEKKSKFQLKIGVLIDWLSTNSSRLFAQLTTKFPNLQCLLSAAPLYVSDFIPSLFASNLLLSVFLVFPFLVVVLTLRSVSRASDLMNHLCVIECFPRNFAIERPSLPFNLISLVALLSACFTLSSFSELCCLFCCPPCPNRIAAKLAFLPPEPTYNLVANEEVKSKFQLQLNEKAEWPYNERDKDTIESYYTRTSRGNRIACIFVKCCTNARYTLLFSHGNAVDLGQMSSFYLGLGSRINCNIFR